MSKHHSSRRGGDGGSSEERESRKRERRRIRNKKAIGIFWNIFKQVVFLFHLIFDKIVEICLEKYWGEKTICPPIVKDEEYIMKSATELAEMIRQKKLKSYDLVKAYIDRINQINPILNAVVDGPFMEALDEAKAIDERIAKGQISEDEFSEKLFLGLPFSTKDSTSVKDKLHTLGLKSRKNIKSKEDAECVRLMKEAGAVIIATSNIPEVNMWCESRNFIIGQTNNPYDTRRTVGGSSGGEAALVASCGNAFGIGTDIGGSIRIPAFCCGVFGHKPTVGLVNTRGCTLRTGKETSTMVCAGPIARHAIDLLPLFKVLVGPTNSAKLKLDATVDVKRLKYYYIKQNNDLRTSPVSGELQSTLTKAVEHISELTGQKVELVSLHGIEQSLRMWRYWMSQEPSDYLITLGNGVRPNLFVELAKKLAGKSDFTMASIYGLIDGMLPKEDAKKMRELTRKCDEELTELLGDDGILLYHSSPHAAPFHYFPYFKMYDTSYFSIFNVLQVPATQIPMGLNSNGIPLGIQVVATRNRDSHCIAVARELEKTFGGWVPPFQPSN